MKKRTIAIILVFVLALGMMACGDGGAASVTNTGNNETAQSDTPSNNTESQDTEEEFVETPGRTIQGPATVDVGSFSVDLPEGWLGIHEFDWDSLADDDEAVEFDPTMYNCVKGAQTSQDEGIDTPNVELVYFNDTDSETLLENIKSYMNEVTELDVELEWAECTAVHTVLEIEGSEPDESDFVFIPLSDTSCFRAIINTSGNGVQTGISVEDSDVLAILNSIKLK